MTALVHRMRKLLLILNATIKNNSPLERYSKLSKFKTVAAYYGGPIYQITVTYTGAIEGRLLVLGGHLMTKKQIAFAIGLLALSAFGEPLLAADAIAAVKSKLQVLREQQAKQGMHAEVANDAAIQAATTAGTPQIVGIAYSTRLTPGSTTTIHVLVYNPGSTASGELVATFFSGPSGNLADQLWPMISREIPSLDPGQMSAWFELTFTVPNEAVRGASYAGNWILWRPNTFDKGEFLDRASFEQMVSP
jgi:hypothetical protein